ncbi:MAG TPA: hypothetical protein VLJ57_01355, partial [Burkholderiaceae bacterium]|nr:hypothetical protein [Burkholderiaceae bacterium]
MPTREEFIREVTDFFNAEKALVGIDEPLTWQPNRDPSEHCLKIPIEIDGVQFGQQLVIVSRPGSATLDFSLVVIHGVAVCRLDFDETGGHTNSFSSHIDALPVQVVGSHFHRWSV